MQPSQEELIKWWSYAYSRTAFLEVLEFIDALEQNRVFSHLTVRAFTTAIIISYARPFTVSQVTKSKRIIPLKDVNPPKELLLTHNKILSFRDKTVGHKDATIAQGEQTTPNIIYISKDSEGFDSHTIIAVNLAPDLLKNIRELCGFFLAHCESTLKSILRIYGPQINNLPIDKYELVIDDPSQWIRPHRPV